MTTPNSVCRPAILQSPRRIAHPTNDFVRFEEQWTQMSIPDCFRARMNAGWSEERLALGLPDRDLTYRELDQLSDCLAHALYSLGGNKAEPILLFLEHDANVPAAMLGVLKVGKFSVPLDPSHPLERNRHVLNDSQAEILITNNKNLFQAASLCGTACRVVNLEDITSQFSGGYPREAIDPDRIAQVLYTSGSSGKPKGVIRTHRGLLFNVRRHTNGRHICLDDRIAILILYSFGSATVHLLSALLNGAAAFPFNVRQLGVIRLAEWLGNREITQFYTVPTLFRHFVEALDASQIFPHLRLIELGGETTFAKDLERFREHFVDHCLLSVGLGSTEAGHLFDCRYSKETECSTDILPVGYPTEGTEAFLLDERGQLTGEGCVGEIAVKGGGLAFGYWKQPELTSRVFLPDPSGGPDLIYLTGDLGYRLPDGCMFHMGRKDDLVKIRGYRIEIPEVEAALLRIPGMKEAAVIAKGEPSEERRLAAYFVLDAGVTLPLPQLRKALRENLPDYMVPSEFFILESLPLLPNGKVDRQGLPQHAQQVPASGNFEAIPPLLSLEAQLCAIWQELLRVPHVGIHDDFFDLGGDSLLAVEMAVQIEDVLGVKFSVAEFPSEITIERLAEAMAEQARQDSKTPLKVIQSGGSRTPFFFHNGDLMAGGLYCRNLARLLGSDQPFYSLMTHGFYKDHVPGTIEAMASDHLKSVLAIQPKGPYVLGGYCHGGVVALEMARQLQLQGQEVTAVLMVDSPARDLRFRFVRKIVALLAATVRLEPETEAKIFRKLQMFLSVFREVRKESAWRAVCFVGGKIFSLAIRGVRFLAHRLIQKTNNSDVQPPDKWDLRRHIWDLRRLNHLAMEAYVPNEFPGKIVFFRSTHVMERAPDDPTAGWKHVTPEITVEWLPGNHYTCLTHHVDDLARKMGPHLAQAVDSAPPEATPPASNTRIGQKSEKSNGVGNYGENSSPKPVL